MNNYGVAYPAANQGDVATRLNVGWLRFFTLIQRSLRPPR